jgi:hypothetical protein
MVSRLARLEVELCSTTRGLPVPSLTLTPAKLNPFLVARFPHRLPPWLLGEWPRIREVQGLDNP